MGREIVRGAREWTQYVKPGADFGALDAAWKPGSRLSLKVHR